MCINIRYFSWDTSTSFFFLLKKNIKLYWADRVMYGFKGLLFFGLLGRNRSRLRGPINIFTADCGLLSRDCFHSFSEEEKRKGYALFLYVFN